MAQQLATFRSPEAYAGVLHNAQTHTGEAAAAAYLALGHAYYQDKRDEDAVRAFQRADQLTTELNDYAVYLEALALEQGNHSDQALTLLTGYSAKFPESIFNGNLPVIIARMQVENNQPQAALTTSKAASTGSSAARASCTNMGKPGVSTKLILRLRHSANASAFCMVVRRATSSSS